MIYWFNEWMETKLRYMCDYYEWAQGRKQNHSPKMSSEGQHPWSGSFTSEPFMVYVWMFPQLFCICQHFKQALQGDDGERGSSGRFKSSLLAGWVSVYTEFKQRAKLSLGKVTVLLSQNFCVLFLHQATLRLRVFSYLFVQKYHGRVEEIMRGL